MLRNYYKRLKPELSLHMDFYNATALRSYLYSTHRVFDDYLKEEP